MATCEGSSPFSPTIFYESNSRNKKGLEKNLKVFVDKNTINKELDVKYDQLKNDVVLKGLDQEEFQKI